VRRGGKFYADDGSLIESFSAVNSDQAEYLEEREKNAMG